MSTQPLPDDYPQGVVVNLHNAMDSAPEWARHLATEIAEIKEVHTKILAIVEEIRPDVESVISSIQNNPMAKMFLGGRR